MNQRSSWNQIAGGTLEPTDPSYIERLADQELLEGLERQEFCFILSSRQMGKSSLLAKASHSLRKKGWRVAVLDMTEIGTEGGLVHPNIWYKNVCDILLQRTGSRLSLTELWDETDSKTNSRRFYEVLTKLTKESDAPLAILVDEIDSTISLPFTDDFFAAIRAIYNRRAYEPHLRNLSIVLSGVAAPHELIKDKSKTPFNIGRRIEVNDFSFEEACTLIPVENEKLKSSRDQAVRRIMYWTGGQPYLTHLICALLLPFEKQYDSSSINAEVDKLIDNSLLADGAEHRQAHLRHIAERLKNYHGSGGRRQLRKVLISLLHNKTVPDRPLSQSISALKLAGIVRVNSDGKIRITNQVYRLTFTEHWLKEELKDPKTLIRQLSYTTSILLSLLMIGGVIFYPAQLLGTMKSLERDAKTAGDLYSRLDWFPWMRESAKSEYARILRTQFQQTLSSSAFENAESTFNKLSKVDSGAKEFVKEEINRSYANATTSIKRNQLFSLYETLIGKISSTTGNSERLRDFKSPEDHPYFLYNRFLALLAIYRIRYAPEHIARNWQEWGEEANKLDVGEELRTQRIKSNNDQKSSEGTPFHSLVLLADSATESLSKNQRGSDKDSSILQEIRETWLALQRFNPKESESERLNLDTGQTKQKSEWAQESSHSALNVQNKLNDLAKIEPLLFAVRLTAKRLAASADIQGMVYAVRAFKDVKTLQNEFRQSLIDHVISRAYEMVMRDRIDLAITFIEAFQDYDETNELERLKSGLFESRYTGLNYRIAIPNGVQQKVTSFNDARAFVVAPQGLHKVTIYDTYSLYSCKNWIILHGESLQNKFVRFQFDSPIVATCFLKKANLIIVSTINKKTFAVDILRNKVIAEVGSDMLITDMISESKNHILTTGINTDQNITELQRIFVERIDENRAEFRIVDRERIEEFAPQSIELCGSQLFLSGFGKFAVVERNLSSKIFVSENILDYGTVAELVSYSKNKIRFIGKNPQGILQLYEFDSTKENESTKINVIKTFETDDRILCVVNNMIAIEHALPEKITVYRYADREIREEISFQIGNSVKSCSIDDEVVAILGEDQLLRLFDLKSGNTFGIVTVPYAETCAVISNEIIATFGPIDVCLWNKHQLALPRLLSKRILPIQKTDSIEEGNYEKLSQAISDWFLNNPVSESRNITSLPLWGRSHITTELFVEKNILSREILANDKVQNKNMCVIEKRRLTSQREKKNEIDDLRPAAESICVFQISSYKMSSNENHLRLAVALDGQQVSIAAFHAQGNEIEPVLRTDIEFNNIAFKHKQARAFYSWNNKCLLVWNGSSLTLVRNLDILDPPTKLTASNLLQFPLNLGDEACFYERGNNVALVSKRGACIYKAEENRLQSLPFLLPCSKIDEVFILAQDNHSNLDLEFEIQAPVYIESSQSGWANFYIKNRNRQQIFASDFPSDCQVDSLGLIRVENAVDLDSIPSNHSLAVEGLKVSSIPGLNGVLVVGRDSNSTFEFLDSKGTTFNLTYGKDVIQGYQRKKYFESELNPLSTFSIWALAADSKSKAKITIERDGQQIPLFLKWNPSSTKGTSDFLFE